MLSSITWLQFFAAFAVLALVWIIYVYKDDLLGRNKPPDPPGGPAREPPHRVWQVREETRQAIASYPGVASVEDDDDPPFDYEEEMLQEPVEAEFTLLEEVSHEVHQVITDNKEIGSNIGLLDKLRPVVSRYPQMAHPTLRAALQNLIARAAITECGLSLTAAELDGLWPQQQGNFPSAQV